MIPPLPAESLAGVAVTATVAPEPTILYVLSSTCAWCERNYDNIVALAKGSKRPHRFVGIALNEPGGIDSLRVHLAVRPLPFEVFHLTKDADALAAAADLIATPQLAVIEDGKVIKSWVGALTESDKKEVEDYFGTTLPGLRLATEPSR